MSLLHVFLSDVTQKGPPDLISIGDYQEYAIEGIIARMKAGLCIKSYIGDMMLLRTSS